MVFDNILVVCVGNICRSPMAAAMLAKRYPQKHIDSAGVSALVDYPADAKAIEVMATDDTDIESHIAKQISEDLVRQADLILTMSTSQTKWLEDQWPHCRGKTFRIGHWIGKDIEDPYGLPTSVFEVAKSNIIDSLEQWNEKII